MRAKTIHDDVISRESGQERAAGSVRGLLICGFQRHEGDIHASARGCAA
jgi:hypothetical protein